MKRLKKLLFCFFGLIVLYFLWKDVFFFAGQEDLRQISEILPEKIRFTFSFAVFMLVVSVYFSVVEDNHVAPTSQVLFGFSCVLAFVFAFEWVVDPHYISRLKLFPPYVIPMLDKLDYYFKLDDSPDMVVLGSSRAFTIDPSYIQKVTGVSSYNFSTGSGDLEDFLFLARVVTEDKITDAPSLLLIEIHPALNVDSNRITPWLDMRVVNKMKKAVLWRAIGNRFQDYLRMQTFSDALYVVLFATVADGGEKTSANWTFFPDGYAKAGNKIEIRDLDSEIKKKMGNATGYECPPFDQYGIQNLENLVEVAEKSQTAVLFYISPIEGQWLASIQDYPDVITCKRSLAQYMNNLKRSHSNVFFVNAMDYTPVTQMGADGFYDYHHLRPAAANRLVDYLAKTIMDAYAWSQKQRKP